MIKRWGKQVFAVPLASMAIALAADAAAEIGVTDTSILLGQSIGVTGQIASSVKELNEGTNAYLAQVNKRGGVHGRRIELITLDDKFDPALTAINAETLVKKERVFALFQIRGTPHTEAILPLMKANNVPLVAPSTGAAILHTPVNRLLFNVRAKYQAEVIKAVEHFDTIGVKSIGLLHVDDSFGRDSLAGFTNAMEARKLPPAIVAKFDRAKPDINATIASAVKANPGALIIVGSATTTADLIKGIRAQGSHAILMTLSNNSSQGFIKSLGAAGAGVIVSQITPVPNLVTTSLGKELQVAAQASGGTVSYAAMEGFIAAKVLVEGLQRAGRNLTREGFIRALESMQKVDLGGLMVTYGPDDHTGSEFVELTMIRKDGSFVR